MTTLDLSVVIITCNEEGNLGRCLESLPAGCEIIVLDSGSTDRTEAIAREHGAVFSLRPFEDYSSQKNAAIDLATRHWVLSLDADEELDSKLRTAILDVAGEASGHHIAFPVKRRLVFQGKLMRFGKTSDAPLRLFRRDKTRFVEPIHERLDVPRAATGPTLAGTLLHHSYASLTDYFSRFNQYTSRIAENHFKKEAPAPSFLIHACRPFIEFLNRYVLRLGFLDGRPGYSYALFSSLYAYVKYDKLIERYGSERPK